MSNENQMRAPHAQGAWDLMVQRSQAAAPKTSTAPTTTPPPQMPPAPASPPSRQEPGVTHPMLENLKDLRAEAARMNETMRSLQARVTSLEAERDALAEENAKLQAAAKASAGNTAASATAKAQAEKIARLEAERAALAQENTKLQAQVSDAREKCSAQTAENARLTSENSYLAVFRKQAEDLKSENESLVAKLRDMDTAQSGLSSELSRIRSENIALESALEMVRDAHDKMTAEHTALMLRHQQANADLVNARAICRAAEQQAEVINKANNTERQMLRDKVAAAEALARFWQEEYNRLKVVAQASGVRFTSAK